MHANRDFSQIMLARRQQLTGHENVEPSDAEAVPAQLPAVEPLALKPQPINDAADGSASVFPFKSAKELKSAQDIEAVEKRIDVTLGATERSVDTPDDKLRAYEGFASDARAFLEQQKKNFAEKIAMMDQDTRRVLTEKFGAGKEWRVYADQHMLRMLTFLEQGSSGIQQKC